MSGHSISRKDPVATGGDGVLSCFGPNRAHSGPFPPEPYHPRVIRTHGIGRAPAIAFLLLALLPIACSTDPGGTATATPPVSGPTDGATKMPLPSLEPPPTLPGQSVSTFGAIWNGVPDSFPVPVDALVADPQQGPVSGAWTVPVTAVSAPQLAGYYRNALDELGWTVALDGPLEDGSYTVASSSTVGCETLTTILPRGDESLITTLFGAGCPWR